MTEELMLSILFPIMIYLFTAICIFMTYEMYHSLKKDKANWSKLYQQEKEIDKLKKDKEELLNTIATKVRATI
tara:strand:- start:46 stop:264 length:219 start_codon:yes stop_codon:yes gene_type:complete